MRKEREQVPKTVREYLSSFGKKKGPAKTEAKVEAARRLLSTREETPLALVNSIQWQRRDN
jgi:hypothetical protein